MMEDFEGSRTEFMKMLAERDGPPAYILRAQRVEEVWLNLIERCEQEKNDLLQMARTRLAQLGGLVNHQWESVSCHVTNSDYDKYLAKLFADWQPKLRVTIEPTDSLRKHRGALKDLGNSFARFNRRWKKHVDGIVLDQVNFERREYNDYYLVEKAAALGSDKLAEMGFERLPMCTRDDIIEKVPSLIEPVLV